MYKISKKSLKPFEEWEAPTLQDVHNVFKNLGLSDEKFALFFGISVRTVRRWRSIRTVNRLVKSSIPYGAWCVLIALSENKIIFADIKKRDLSQVPENYICSLENFVSPPKEILTLFVGKRSITGLQRTELASLFGWNSTFLGREINNGHIRFLNWVLLLLFCGVSIKKFIDLKKLLDTM